MRAFWFGAPPLQPRTAWFAKDEAFDAEVRTRFGAAVEAALAGALPAAWHGEPLAEILLLDQFTRNIFRDSPRVFAGDTRAQALAAALSGSAGYAALDPLERVFVVLPFEHAENAALQDEAVRLFGELAALRPDLAGYLDYARRHRDVIRRFGRFPHRNAALGRESTADERAFLAQPGSRF